MSVEDSPATPEPGSPPQPRRNTRTWVLIGVGVAAVAAVVAAATLLVVGRQSGTATGDAPAAPAETDQPGAPNAPASAQPGAPNATPAGRRDPMVTSDQLAPLLLDAPTVNGIMGATDMAVDPSKDVSRPYKGVDIGHPECGGILMPAQFPVYRGSGWLSTRNQWLSELNVSSWQHGTNQAVFSFANPRRATQFVAREADSWGKCNGVTFPVPPDPPVNFSANNVKFTGGLLTAQLIQEGGNGWTCQRAMTARANVVVDIRTCGYSITNQAVTIADKIGERVPGQ